MPINVSNTGLRMLHLVEVNLRSDGITADVRDGSLCLFKPVYDRPSGTTYGMASAIASLAKGPEFARFYCIEQTDTHGELVKFVYRITDTENSTLHEWHKDISHGLHTHPIVGGKKQAEHIPYSGGDTDVLNDILSEIRQLQIGI